VVGNLDLFEGEALESWLGGVPEALVPHYRSWVALGRKAESLLLILSHV